MGKAEWFDQPESARTEPQWHSGPEPAAPEALAVTEPVKKPRRWPYVAAIAALAIGIAAVSQSAEDDKEQQERTEKAAAYKGSSQARLNVDGVMADVVAKWTKDKNHVVLELQAPFESNSKYLRIDAQGKSAHSIREDGWYPKAPEIVLPVKDPLADVTVRVAIGGKSWKPNVRVPSKSVRLSPTGDAYDAKTGKRLSSGR
ncbi:hypothetical protein F3K32_43120 [Streptomyces sp. LBUM 1483]|uniref:hypothetical protein n=1 Tax=Streptomyces scabiei TaxID=1930 RepID=UPI001B33FBB4|nr:hypothetical protein [Streptomyces sp. LBUM 1483]MBP5926796.1 hypothetical protein [Streptomyces sp. LBUM 1483]